MGSVASKKRRRDFCFSTHAMGKGYMRPHEDTVRRRPSAAEERSPLSRNLTVLAI